MEGGLRGVDVDEGGAVVGRRVPFAEVVGLDLGRVAAEGLLRGVSCCLLWLCMSII